MSARYAAVVIFCTRLIYAAMIQFSELLYTTHMYSKLQNLLGFLYFLEQIYRQCVYLWFYVPLSMFILIRRRVHFIANVTIG